jgi:hypothetical protein
VARDLAAIHGPEAFVVGLVDRNSLGQPLTLFETSPLSKELIRSKRLLTPEWWTAPQAVVFEGSVQNSTGGFTTGMEPATTDQQQVAYKVTAKPGPGTTVNAGANASFTPTQSDRKVTAGVRVEEGVTALTAELGDRRSEQRGQATHERTLAAKYEYRLTKAVTVSVGRRVSYEQADLSLTTLGAAAASGRLTAETEYATGERQRTGSAKLAYDLPAGARLYSSWEGGERDGVSQNRLTFGGSTSVSAKTRLFVERKLDVGSSGVAATETAGAEYRPNDRLGYSFSFGRGVAVNGAERTSGTLALNWREDDRQASTAMEVANQSDGRQDVSLKGKAEVAVTPEVSLVGRTLVSQTSGAGFTGGNVTEVALGTAYRPVDGGRLNLLSQVTLRSENGDASGTGGDGTAVRSLVLSTEGLYRVNRSWRAGGKVAWKRAAAGDGGVPVDTALVASRLLYRVSPGVELAGEYRAVKQGPETSAGPVFELNVAFPGTDAVWLGLGYNYAGFSDSLLGDPKEAGWFLRIRGLL